MKGQRRLVMLRAMAGRTAKPPLAPLPDEAILAHFHKHIVPVFLKFRRGDNVQWMLMSAFLMSIYDQWLLMTAGHNIDEVNEAKRHGFRIESASLIDTVGSQARHQWPIPFDYDGATPVNLCYDEKFDYGIIFIRDHFRRLLEANGIQPFNEEAWLKEPNRVDAYVLIGMPKSDTHLSASMLGMKPTMLRVQKLLRRPSEFKPTKAPTFWGKILELPPSLPDIVGMSGGPILALRQEGDQLRYWLHAVQSRWYKPKRKVAACLMKPLGVFLREFMEGRHDNVLTTSE